jgi:transposase
MELLEFLEGQLQKAERALYGALQQGQRVELLMSIPGIGRLTAHLLLAEIGEVGRFRRAKKLVSYAGLSPRVMQSANRFRTGHTGGGRKYLKWGLIEAARTASYRDPWLSRFYGRVKRKKGSAKAIVAVARKLAHVVWRVLSEERPYRPGRAEFPGSARPTHGGRRR